MTTNDVRDDTHSDYAEIKAQASAAMKRGVWTQRFDPRFVPLGSREMRSDIPKQAVASISEGKHYISYRGAPMAKDPFDMVLYEILLFELQPRTIIELGAYTGASAMWMADTLRCQQIKSHVYSVDIDLELVDETAMQTPGVTFLQGDCNRIEEIFPADMLAGLPHPVMLIDDAHVNIHGVYSHFDAHALRSGDYLIVEDIVPWIPGSFGKTADETEWGDWKWNEIREFFAGCDDAYLVDRYYTDFFGYNVTWNWNGFLKKM